MTLEFASGKYTGSRFGKHCIISVFITFSTATFLGIITSSELNT